MTATAYSKGHPIQFIDNEWVYDNGEPVSSPRNCPKCSLLVEEGKPDPCLGYLDGVVAACCGHGVKELTIIYEEKTN